MGLCTAIRHLVVQKSLRSSAPSSEIQRSESGLDIASVYVKGFPEAGSRLRSGIVGSSRGVWSPPAKRRRWCVVKSYESPGGTISGGAETPAEPNARWGFRRGLRCSGGVGPGSGGSGRRSAIGGSVGTEVWAYLANQSATSNY